MFGNHKLFVFCLLVGGTIYNAVFGLVGEVIFCCTNIEFETDSESELRVSPI